MCELFLLTSSNLVHSIPPSLSLSLNTLLDLRHEEIPGECKSRVEPCLSRSSSPRDAMFVDYKLCEVGERCSRVSNLDNDYQCCGHGYAKKQIASR